MTPTNPIEYKIEQILNDFNPFNISYNDFIRLVPVAKQAIKDLLLEARNNSLLDLEQWIKLHDLGQDMILDGIEHMVKSNLQVPDQPRLDHADRITELTSQLGSKE